MEQLGRIERWDDDKGFGFIAPEQGGQALFLHISALRGLRRPSTGDRVLYVPGKDAQGRPRAEHARFDELSLDSPAIRRKPRPPNPPANQASPRGRPPRAPVIGAGRWPLKLVLWLGFCGLPLAGSLQLWHSQGVVWPLLAYLSLSCVSFIQYWNDKRHAQKGRWRTPESTLHLTALLGGWPGAWVAQQVFRHKTRKGAFQAVFWASVLLHQLFWVDRLLLDGQFAALLLLYR